MGPFGLPVTFASFLQLSNEHHRHFFVKCCVTRLCYLGISLEDRVRVKSSDCQLAYSNPPVGGSSPHYTPSAAQLQRGKAALLPCQPTPPQHHIRATTTSRNQVPKLYSRYWVYCNSFPVIQHKIESRPQNSNEDGRPSSQRVAVDPKGLRLGHQSRAAPAAHTRDI